MAILDDSFENLEQVPKRVVKQVAKLPGDIVSGAMKSVVGRSDQPGGKKIDPLTGIEIPTPQRVQQIKKQEKKLKKAAIPHAQQIIQGIQKQSGQNIPAYVAGKPGFSEEKVIKAHEIEEKQKKELPPPVSAAKRKGGTGERRLMGSSG